MVRDVDWNNLINQRAPYVPEDAEYEWSSFPIYRQLDALLKQIEVTPSSAPEFPQLIRMLARNFDNFPEKPLDGRNVFVDSE